MVLCIEKKILINTTEIWKKFFKWSLNITLNQSSIYYSINGAISKLNELTLQVKSRIIVQCQSCYSIETYQVQAGFRQKTEAQWAKVLIQRAKTQKWIKSFRSPTRNKACITGTLTEKQEVDLAEVRRGTWLKHKEKTTAETNLGGEATTQEGRMHDRTGDLRHKRQEQNHPNWRFEVLGAGKTIVHGDQVERIGSVCKLV